MPKWLFLAAVFAALAAAPEAYAAELLAQPRNVERTQIVRVEWTAAEAIGTPEIVVERRHGLFWVAEEADVLVADRGAGEWSARWRPGLYAPSGVYRLRIAGLPYGLTSDTFRVRPCECVIPRLVRSRWRGGRFRLRLTAQYAAGAIPGFPALPKRVVTGRPLVRVMRDGRRIGSARLRYRRGAFRGSWAGPRGPRYAVVFELVSLRDAFGNG